MSTKKNKEKYRLPKEFGNKWLEALRSGKYEQTSEVLMAINEDNNNKSYCCLGVACEIAGHSRLLKREGHVGYPHMITSKSGRNNLRNVPKELKDKDSELPNIVANLNDEGKSFKQIALWIERNVTFY